MFKLLISIPNTKASTRFPGKNKVLAHYTVDWLNEELKSLPADWQVKVIEVVSPFTDETCTPYEKFLVSYEDDHLKLTEALQKAFSVDMHIHVQLTQPKRRRGLLKDCINTLLATKADVVSTYVTWRNDYNWRELKRKDDKVMFTKELRSDEHVSLYDGALYCARELPKIFDTELTWDFVYNGTRPVCDIDFREEIQ